MDAKHARAALAYGAAAQLLGGTRPALSLLRTLIAERAGVYYDDGKLDLLADKLAELVAARGLSSYLDYYYLLRYDSDERHWAELLDRIAVPETYFWRQPEQLLAVASALVPAHAAAHPGEPFRIWSAACCSGEEPLSIALALAEAGWLDRAPIEIVASDASQRLVARARQGVFGERSFRALPERLREKYFCRGPEGWRIDPRLLARVTWTTANLMLDDEVRPLAASHVIFCRNVFIYFSDDTIERVVARFAEHMRAPAHLFVGSSESLTRFATAFDLTEIADAFVYRRRADAPATSSARR